jgi:hypothetical protein
MKHTIAIMFKATLSSIIGLYINNLSVLEIGFVFILKQTRHGEISVPLGSGLHSCPQEVQDTMKINSLKCCIILLSNNFKHISNDLKVYADTDTDLYILFQTIVI